MGQKRVSDPTICKAFSLGINDPFRRRQRSPYKFGLYLSCVIKNKFIALRGNKDFKLKAIMAGNVKIENIVHRGLCFRKEDVKKVYIIYEKYFLFDKSFKGRDPSYSSEGFFLVDTVSFSTLI